MAENATDRAAGAVRAMILGGELAQGARLVENRLSAALGVSRPPLREALRVLQQEGLVEQLPRQGAAVRTLTLHDVFEIVTLRTTLETMAVRLGVPSPEPARLAELADALATLERRAADGRADAEDSYRFHLALVALSGNSRLVQAYRPIALQLRLCIAAGDLPPAARHRDLFALIEKGDVVAVIAELRDPAALRFVLSYADGHPPGTPASAQWLDALRRRVADRS